MLIELQNCENARHSTNKDTQINDENIYFYHNGLKNPDYAVRIVYTKKINLLI